MKNITLIANDTKTTITPSKIVCIGRNYVEHAKELGNAVPSKQIIFLKPNSSISATLASASNSGLEKSDVTNGEVELHHYEAELCFIINNNAISAVGFGLDLTRRDTQLKLKEKGLPWERAKVFDGAAVFSHFIPVAAADIANLALSLEINDKVIQQGDVSMMLFKPQDIIDEVLTFLSFEDGDIIMTGTPAGVGVINKGDQFKGSVYLNNNKLIEQTWTAI